MFKTTFKQWLLHFFMVWAAINVYDSFDFLFKRTSFDHYTNSDGSPITVFQRLVEHNFYRTDVLYLLVFTFLVELNYQHVFKRYRWIVFTISSLFTVFLMICFFMITSHKERGNSLEPAMILFGYTVAYAIFCEFLNHRSHLLKVRLKSSETELQVLKQQLNPHFLFNTLNYLYGTALQENASRTAEGIEIMSGMMRYTVVGMQETVVPLTEEIQFIKQYLYLQQVRMPLNDTHSVEVSIEVANQSLFIAPMLLIPFIENAFKYGKSADNPAEIKIRIHLLGAELKMMVSNTIATGQNSVKGTNSGLELTRRRLALLYPVGHKLDISSDGKTYIVIMSLKLKEL